MKAFLLAAAIIAVSTWAFADAVVTVVSTTHQVVGGSFSKLPDAGWHFIVCGQALQSDGGIALLGSQCIPCDPGAFGNLPTTCGPLHKTANGL